MIVRRERPADHDAVRALHRAAFRPARPRADGVVVEARLTDELRDDVGFLPGEQFRGVGTVLVHSLLAVAEAAGERLAALLGSPAYYRRFGFRTSTEVGVTAPDPAWGEHFMARWLGEQRAAGTFRYADPFQRR